MSERIPIEVLMRCYAEQIDRRNARALKAERAEASALKEAILRLVRSKQKQVNPKGLVGPKPIRTVCAAVRHVIATKVNGHPVTRRFLIEETSTLIPCDSTTVNGALIVCAKEGLIERGNQFGTWQKPKREREDGA